MALDALRGHAVPMLAIAVLGGTSLVLLMFAMLCLLTGYWVSALLFLGLIALIWYLWARFG